MRTVASIAADVPTKDPRRRERRTLHARVRHPRVLGTTIRRTRAACILRPRCLDSAARVHAVPLRRSSRRADPGDEAALVGSGLSPLRPLGRAVLRGRLLPLPVGRIPVRHGRHALWRDAGGILPGRDGAEGIAGRVGPDQPSGTADDLRADRATVVPAGLLDPTRQRDDIAGAVDRRRPGDDRPAAAPRAGAQRPALRMVPPGSSRRSPSPRIRTVSVSVCCWPPSSSPPGATGHWPACALGSPSGPRFSLWFWHPWC